MYYDKIEYVIQQETSSDVWTDHYTHNYLKDAREYMAQLQEWNPDKYFRVVKRMHTVEEQVYSYSVKPKPTTVTLNTTSKVTTINLEGGLLYYVYEYNNGSFIDIVVRNRHGKVVNNTHDLYKEIMDEYNKISA